MGSGLRSAVKVWHLPEVTDSQGFIGHATAESRSDPWVRHLDGSASGNAGAPNPHALSCQAEDETETRINSGHRFRRSATDTFSEEGAIGGEDLRDVDNR